MRAVRTFSKAGLLIPVWLTTILLSGCLTRKSVLHPDGGTAPPTHKRTSKGTIITDASSAPKDVRTGGKKLLEGYAAVLGVPPPALQNPSLYAYIDDWMGVPHRTGGTDRSGLDCSAFVGMVMRDIYGKQLPRVSSEIAESIKRKYERQLQEGDLVFFSFGRRNIDHVGIYLQNNKFVHVSTSKGVIISDLHDTWYYRYFTRAGTPR